MIDALSQTLQVPTQEQDGLGLLEVQRRMRDGRERGIICGVLGTDHPWRITLGSRIREYIWIKTKGGWIVRSPLIELIALKIHVWLLWSLTVRI